MLRETAEPLRELDVPLVRTAEEPLRDVLLAEERETLVRPVEDRRTAEPLPETVLALLRVERVMARELPIRAEERESSFGPIQLNGRKSVNLRPRVEP